MTKVYVIKIKGADTPVWLDSYTDEGKFIVGIHKEKSGEEVKRKILLDSVELITERDSQF